MRRAAGPKSLTRREVLLGGGSVVGAAIAAGIIARAGSDTPPEVFLTDPNGPKRFPRPVGTVTVAGKRVPYVAVESLGFTAGADLNDILSSVRSPAVLTFPQGEFSFDGFATGFVTGATIDNGGEGHNGNVCGLVGSGPGSLDRRTSGTYFTLKEHSSRLHGSAVDSALMMKASDVRALVLGQFRLAGSEQGHAFSGLQLYHPREACHVYDVCVDGWAGYANIPPGETTGFSIIDLGDGVRRDHLIERVEADGRRADGKKYGAAPLGGQNMNGSEWVDCYGHHAVASQCGWSVSRNVTTRNLRAHDNGSGHALKSGQGINHELTDGFVHHGPTIDVPRANGNTGVHISHSNYDDVSFGPGQLLIIDPTFLVDGAIARGVATSWAPYRATCTAKPHITALDGENVNYVWTHP